MNWCVPDWDVSSEALDSSIPSSEFLPMAKGKWESVPQRKSNCFDLAFVPDHEFVELLWENGQIVVQGQTSRSSKRPLSASLPSHLSKALENDDAMLPEKPCKDGTLGSVVQDMESAIERSIPDDEMVSWLHDSIDDSLGRDYSSDFFGEVPPTYSNPVVGQMSSAPPDKGGNNDQVQVQVQESSSLPRVANAVSSATVCQEPTSKRPTADEAMALGAGRVSGLIPQTGVQASKLRTASQPLVSKWCNDLPPTSNSKNTSSVPNGSQPPCKTITQVSVSSLGMPPPKMQQFDLAPMKAVQSGRSGLMNFSHFSRPAAMMKANLQSIGISAGLSRTERLKKMDKIVVNGNASPESSRVESTTSGRSTIGSSNGGNNQFQDHSQTPTLGTQSNCQTHHSPLLRKVSSNAKCLDDVTDSSAKAPPQTVCQSSSFSESVALGGTEMGRDARKVTEPTHTSSSGGSGNNAGRIGKEATNQSKRKDRDVDDSECQSEDVEEESADIKRPTPSRTTTAKRSRAAEVHNQSERRRRDRINEKMRALQELIPNCNKSDKASMLDEAIEYLKTLQLQVQIMSMGGGMCMPPVMFPAGMQHFAMPQMAHFSSMGMGMATASGPPVMALSTMHGSIPGPPGLPMSKILGSGLPMSGIPGSGLTVSMLPGSALPVSGLPAKTLAGSALSGTVCPRVVSSSTPSSIISEDHMQNANLMNSFKLGLDCQPLQVLPQAMNVNASNTPMVQTHEIPGQMNGSGTSNAITRT
eukprot:Gb_07156 [translate_table: standard]